MFNRFRDKQFKLYNQAKDYFIQNPGCLIEIEKYFSIYLYELLLQAKNEIEEDFNEASFLYPFWQNYPPDERGRKPKGDQFPWIEVGEHVFCPKIARKLTADFKIRDCGIPSGPDERFIVANDKIKSILKITDSAWLFIDIKSVGPRDDQDHAVMSHNQISGDGIWTNKNKGIQNTKIFAVGERAKHDFHCAIPPLFILSNESIVPVVHFVIKPVYKMLSLESRKESGQPLSRINLIAIPNGLLLTINPDYISNFTGLFFPGKDDKEKDPRKMRARISFEKLRQIDDWRFKEVKIT